MKVVYMFAGDLGATLHARMIPLARALRNFKIDCRVAYPINWSTIVGMRLGKALFAALPHPLHKYIEVLKKSHIVIIGRLSTAHIYLFQKILKHKGVKVIFDLDDPLFLPLSKVFSIKIRSPLHIYLEKMMSSADFVTVCSHYLLKYAKLFNNRSDIILDPIDTEIFSPRLRRKKSHKKVTIGWQGDPRGHYNNLGILIKPLEKLALKYDFKFKIVSYLGDLKVKLMFSKLERLIEIDYGSENFLPIHHFAELLSDIDIMVAPLVVNPKNEAKSSLRIGIGMALGVPVVASPVGEQKYIIKHGINGFLAQNDEEWCKYLGLLMEDEDLRKSIGQEARKTAEKELSLKQNAKKLYNIIRSLID